MHRSPTTALIGIDRQADRLLKVLDKYSLSNDLSMSVRSAAISLAALLLKTEITQKLSAKRFIRIDITVERLLTDSNRGS